MPRTDETDRPNQRARRLLAAALAVLAITGGSFTAAGCGGGESDQERDEEDSDPGSDSDSDESDEDGDD